MRIKLDENLPRRLAPRLRDLGHDVHTPDDEGLRGAEDGSIWEATQREQRFLITQDLDFSDMRRFTPGSHKGVLLVRLLEPKRRVLIDRILTLFREGVICDWTGCLVVAGERKVRVRRPPPG
jgi:predicted nuclease of predicted toxin-antitoxin system